MQNINETIYMYGFYQQKARSFLTKIQGYCEDIDVDHTIYELRMTIFEGLQVKSGFTEGSEFTFEYNKLDGEKTWLRVPFNWFVDYLKPEFVDEMLVCFAQQLIDERQEYFEERDRKERELREMAAKMGYVLQPK